ncbi:hypothetical protein AB1L42_16035 [Thalassoglobus sp. JC818]|uniref:hypothetical protein n=1 Tax=Thalassoglobus sp. JC818 TaxID=3232136 RepID=UPI00345813B9
MSNELTIQVDGQHASPSEIVLHFQADPFPGGHRYEMVIPRKAISGELWEYTKFEDTKNPSEDQARNWFYWIPSLLQRQDEAARAKFVLNNVQHIRVSHDEVLLCGDCSPFVTTD